MSTSLRNSVIASPRNSLLVAGFLLAAAGPVWAKPVKTIDVLVNTAAPYLAGASTNTIFFDLRDEDNNAPSAGETIHLKMVANGVEIANTVSPTSFTTDGTTLMGAPTLLPTLFRSGSNLQLKATPTQGGTADESVPFTVTAGAAAKLLLLGPGMTHFPGTNPSAPTTGSVGTFLPQGANQPFQVTVILTDAQFNTVALNHNVSFPAVDLVALPSPGTLSNGQQNFNVTIQADKITRTLTVEDDTSPGTVSDGTLVVTTVGPPAKEVFAFPSPFNPARGESVTFRFFLSVGKSSRLWVKDQFGQDVFERSLGAVAGTNDVTWDGRNDRGHIVAAGIYYVVLEVDGSVESKKRFGVKK